MTLFLAQPTRQPEPGKCPRCGSRERKDFTIHGGQSIRRDCARCGHTLGFPVWYGQKEPQE